MSLQEIETAITKLTSEERARLSAILAAHEGDAWDKRIETDARSGKLDALVTRAKEQNRQGLTRLL